MIMKHISFGKIVAVLMLCASTVFAEYVVIRVRDDASDDAVQDVMRKLNSLRGYAKDTNNFHCINTTNYQYADGDNKWAVSCWSSVHFRRTTDASATLTEAREGTEDITDVKEQELLDEVDKMSQRGAPYVDVVSIDSSSRAYRDQLASWGLTNIAVATNSSIIGETRD